MSRNIALTVALLFSFLINIPSRAVAMPANTLTILPADCTTLVGKEVPLTLDGFVPPNTVVGWAVSDGGITSVMPGLNAVFIAPANPMVVTISVSISHGVPGRETLITRHCIVTSPHSAPSGLARAVGMDPQ